MFYSCYRKAALSSKVEVCLSQQSTRLISSLQRELVAHDGVTYLLLNIN